ncbi:TPA: Gfo/Idh/MocA family oxidoreductase [Candidatus Poribacteria bacterium]|nr:Gfo/Idh/MocA family oxidoreductase [Candidatus Poribacteria bacterium]
MSNELKVGFVGAPRASGFIGTFQAVTETMPIALCDIRSEILEQVGDRFSIEQRYTDYEKMVGADLDIIVVMTPMPLHVPQAVMALRSGKHVLSEVPAATDLEQCWQLVSAVRESGKKYMMAENYTYLKPNVLVRELVRRGLFGEVYFGEGEYVHELKGLNEITVWRRKWQTGRNGNTYPTHSLGPLLQWFDDRVATVSCFGSGHHYKDSRGDYYENEDTTLMLCKMQRGGLIKIRLDMLSNRPHNMTYYSLQGAKGCYEASRGFGDSPKIWLADYSDNPNQWRSLWDFEEEFIPEIWRNPPEEALRAGHGGGDYFEVRGFIDSIVNDTKPPIDVYEALDMTAPGLVSEESINNGGIPLPVPDFRTIQHFPDDLPEPLRESSIISVTL